MFSICYSQVRLKSAFLAKKDKEIGKHVFAQGDFFQIDFGEKGIENLTPRLSKVQINTHD